MMSVDQVLVLAPIASVCYAIAPVLGKAETRYAAIRTWGYYGVFVLGGLATAGLSAHILGFGNLGTVLSYVISTTVHIFVARRVAGRWLEA
jgi:hypothetical protein